MSKTILFSGRLDPPHLGHIITLQKLAREYDKVLVVLLDYPQQFYPIQERLKTVQIALEGCRGNFEVIVNNVNFGEIMKEDVDTLPLFDVYAGGNPICHLRMTGLGYNSIAVNRTPGYKASDSVKFQKLMKFLDEEGFLT